MTLEQAERIMGDEDGADHHLNDMGAIEYISPSFARTETMIILSSETNTVIEVICGDQVWKGFDK
jgi:hypothetical protein